MRERTESFLWIVGLSRRSRAPTKADESRGLRPLTVPNLISVARLALIPIFVWLALRSKDGRDFTATLIFAIAAISDYLDGLLARALGQFSRLGVVLDPLVDRLLVGAVMVVSWKFDLLPRWAVAVVIAREILVILLSRYALSRGLEIRVSWTGRFSLWLILVGAGLAMLSDTAVAPVVFVAGVALSLIATAQYTASGLARVKRS